MADRERTNILFLIAALMAAFVYHELGRRQNIGERREEQRKEWVDSQLAHLNEEALGHRERAASVRNLGKMAVGAATVIVGVGALVTLLAAHTL